MKRTLTPGTDTGNRHREPTPGTDTGNRHREPTPGTDTGNRHREPTPGTVLIVDDNEDDVVSARHALGKLFPQLCTRAVHSGEEFIAYLQGKNGFSDRTEFPYPILVLLDLKMGGMDGFDVLVWLRDHPPHNYIPVIVLTVSGEMGLLRRAYALGARSFLTKPLGANELQNAVCGLQDWLELVRSPVLLTSR